MRDGEAVVLVEVAQAGVRAVEGLGQPAGGLLGDVLGEAAWGGARGQDPLDGLVLEGAEGTGVGERGGEVGGGVALAQEQDLTGVVAGEAALRGGEAGEEACTALAAVGEGLLDLGEVGAAAIPGRVDELRVDVHAAAAGRELVARHEPEVGGVDEELVLGDADGEDLGDVVVGHGVAVAVDGDEAVGAADAVEDARRVVGVERQRSQEGALLGEHLELGPMRLPVQAGIAGGALPLGELAAEVLHVAEAAAVEEAPLELPKSALDPGFVIWVPGAAGDRPELVVSGEGEEARVVDGLAPLPAEHDRLLVVVLAGPGGALEAGEGGEVAVHESVEVAAVEDGVALAGGVGEHVREELDRLATARREVDGEGRPVALRHLARSVRCRRQARRGDRPRPDGADVLLHGGVAAVEAGLTELLEDPLRGDLRVALEELGHLGAEGVDLARPRRPHRPLDGGVAGEARQPVLGEQFTDGVAAHREGPGDGPSREALVMEGDGLVQQLGASGPRHGRAPQ